MLQADTCERSRTTVYWVLVLVEAQPQAPPRELCRRNQRNPDEFQLLMRLLLIIIINTQGNNYAKPVFTEHSM